MSLKVRLMLAGLIFAVAFYLGMVRHIFSREFWPGTETLPGFFFFLGLGILLGLNGPETWRRTSSILKPIFPTRPKHPFLLARAILSILTAIVFLAILFGAFITHRVIDFAELLPNRFLLDAAVWKSLLFCLPALPAGVMGIVLGLLLDIAFVLITSIETPEPLHANLPRVHETIRSLLVLSLVSLAGGWSLGHLLLESYPEHRLSLILLPLTICLVILLVTLLENPEKMSTSTGPTQSLRRLLSRAAPEIASPPSTLASLIVVTLGTFAVWELLQWNYTLTNWFGAAETFGSRPTLFILALLCTAAIIVGLITGHRLIPQRLNFYLTTLDRQGLSLAMLGLGVILTAALASHTLKADVLQTCIPCCLLPFLFVILSGLWGLSLVMAIPGLTVGRSDRFELWLTVVGKLSLGVMLTGVVFLLWQYTHLGNLIGLAAGALLAISVGGVAIIYDNPGSAPPARESQTGKFIHTACIIFLYISLVVVLVTVPSLKNGWLKSTRNRSTLIVESPVGAAGLAGSSQSPLCWAGNVLLPERTDPELRNETLKLVRQIVADRERTFFLPLRLLLVNLPRLDDNSLPPGRNRTIDEADMDASLRSLECLFRDHSPESTMGLTLSDLAFRRNHYNLIITFLPTPWPGNHAWPSPMSLVKKLLSQTADPEVLWFIEQIPAHNLDADSESQMLITYLNRITGRDFDMITKPSLSDYEWRIIATRRSLQTLRFE